METSYERKKHVIKSLQDSGVESFFTNGKPSINKAKKKSRELQQMNGGMGCGYVRVVS